jgi:hypothetical protein
MDTERKRKRLRRGDAAARKCTQRPLEGKVQPVRRGSLAASARARQGLGATAR